MRLSDPALFLGGACAAGASAALWAATAVNEPFYIVVAVFAAAFLGTLAGAVTWDGILRWTAPPRNQFRAGARRCCK